MANAIIIVVLLVIAIFAVRGTMKHMRSESSCCGGGSAELPAEEKKLENPVIGKMTVHIKGMSCQHCVNRVTEVINKIDGASAKVNLKHGEAIVSYDRKIDSADVKARVERAGYEVTSIEE